jgi:polyisoprenoid-binding protein YceI
LSAAQRGATNCALQPLRTEVPDEVVRPPPRPRPRHPFSLKSSAPSAQPAADLVAYKVDPVHSTALFRIKHFVSMSYGRFDKLDGKVNWDSAAPEKSSVELTIDAASVNTADPKRDEHLKSPDFFSVKEFPTVTFKSKSVKKKEAGKLEVTGDLTLHGVTKPVTAEVELVGEGDTMPQMGYRAGFETKFQIKRSDFGMKTYLPGLGDDVTIVVSLECSK